MPVPWAPVRDFPLMDVPKLLAGAWSNWFRSVVLALNATTRQLSAVRLTAQGAAIVTTAIATAVPLTDGRYAVRYYLRITRAATTSSSATVTIGWTDGGIACSQTFTALTGNTTASTQNGAVMVRVDAGTTVSYAVAYASVGGTSMQYAIDVDLEQLPQDVSA